MGDDDGLIAGTERTATDLAEDLRSALDELDWIPAELMDRMRSLGDYRSPQTILRSINRALEGQTKVSGELLALVRQAVRFKRRLLRTYADVVWMELGDGSYTTRIEDFTITITPQSRGRWRVNLVHKDGYSPPFPRWQDSLDAAQYMAFISLDNAQNWLFEYEEEQGRAVQ